MNNITSPYGIMTKTANNPKLTGRTRDQRAGIILIYIPEGTNICRILHVRHIRSGHWGPTKGGVQGGETAIEAASRETLEESGIFIYPDYLTRCPTIRSGKHIYFIVYLEKLPAVNIQKSELTNFQWVDVSEFLNPNYSRSKQTITAWRRLAPYLPKNIIYIPYCKDKLTRQILGEERDNVPVLITRYICIADDESRSKVITERYEHKKYANKYTITSSKSHYCAHCDKKVGTKRKNINSNQSDCWNNQIVVFVEMKPEFVSYVNSLDNTNLRWLSLFDILERYPRCTNRLLYGMLEKINLSYM